VLSRVTVFEQDLQAEVLIKRMRRAHFETIRTVVLRLPFARRRQRLPARREPLGVLPPTQQQTTYMVNFKHASGLYSKPSTLIGIWMIGLMMKSQLLHHGDGVYTTFASMSLHGNAYGRCRVMHHTMFTPSDQQKIDVLNRCLTVWIARKKGSTCRVLTNRRFEPLTIQNQMVYSTCI